MESTGLLNVQDPIQLFTLHVVFGPRINDALHEFMEAFNNHKVSTEKNWSPNQMWVNGMMHPNNPLANPGEIDENPEDLHMYGYDPEGPPPVNEDNEVVVEPVDLGNQSEIEAFVLEHINPLGESRDMGIDIYEEAYHLVKQKVGELIVDDETTENG